MKKVFTILSVALAMTATVNAQRVADLEVTEIPAPATITHQQPIAYTFVVRNNGPANIVIGDSIFYRMTLNNNQLQTNVLATILRKDLFPGDTLSISGTISALNVTGTFQNSFCAIAQGVNRSNDSLAMDDGNQANNAFCRQSTFTGPGTNVEKVGGNEIYSTIFPNPAVHNATISFEFGNVGTAQVRVLDLAGREVATFSQEINNPGNQEIKLNTSNMQSGVYFYEVKINEFVVKGKLTVAK